jgi:hypothetical protein
MRYLSCLLLLLAADNPLLEPAREAFVKGQYGKAIALAEPHVKSDPEHAWKIIGGSYCFLKDKPGALKAWNNLGPKDQAFLKYVCSRNGITLP